MLCEGRAYRCPEARYLTSVRYMSHADRCFFADMVANLICSHWGCSCQKWHQFTLQRDEGACVSDGSSFTVGSKSPPPNPTAHNSPYLLQWEDKSTQNLSTHTVHCFRKCLVKNTESKCMCILLHQCLVCAPLCMLNRKKRHTHTHTVRVMWAVSWDLTGEQQHRETQTARRGKAKEGVPEGKYRLIV